MEFAPGGRRYAGACGLIAVAAVFVSPAISAVFVALAGGVLWFYRDPVRRAPDRGILAPADGRVTVIRSAGARLRVGVFMGVTDVHVNRAPLGGTLESVEHTPGAHRPAFSKDSDRNERVRLGFGAFEVVLIAGAFARRITPYPAVGDRVDRGERIAHIAFGSRADVVLPPGVDRDDLRVELGETVRAGETVLAPEPSGGAAG